MRLNLLNLANLISRTEIEEQIIFLNDKYSLNINLLHWESFIERNDTKERKTIENIWVKTKHEGITMCIKHLAVSGIFKHFVSYKSSCNLIGNCFEIGN